MRQAEMSLTEALHDFGQTMKVTINNKDVSKMLLFNCVFFICPTLGFNLTGGAFYYFSSPVGLAIPVEILAFVPVVMSVSMTAGYYCYERYFSLIALRAYLQVLVPAAALMQMAGTMLFLGGLEQLSMSGRVTGLMVWAVAQAWLQGMTQTPFFTMISTICTPVTAGTVMAVVTSIQNVSLMSSTQICASMQMAYGITSTHFDGLATIAMLCGLIRLVPVLLINMLLPEDFSTMQRDLHARIAADDKRRAVQHSAVGRDEVAPSDLMDDGGNDRVVDEV